jgi:ABC-type multidrug transport system ATPase subunit/Ca2+-binding EF-hand superfamily protein
LWRDNVGVAIIVIFFVAVIAYLIQVFFHRRIAALTHQLERFSNRILNQGDLERQVDEQRKRMERIRPKLEIIQRRLNHLSRIMESSADVDIVAVDSMNHNATDLSIDKHGVLIFHADELFDSIDTNGDGSLSYQELNKVLQLDPLELCDFMKRMNGLSSSSTTGASSVDRATFVQYFLEVLDETSNFKLSSEEAGSRWDEMFAAAGATSKGEVPYSVMYLSSMNEFLSDAQIKDVISGFRKAKLSASLKKSATHSEGVTREVFCNHYPGILMKILTDQDNQKQETKKNGIDITFQNLKLVVGVGRSNCVHVVDDVSGRVRKGTMTALMGGSGAGKTSLLNALCGRAYYGEVQGDVFINGQKASVEDFADSIGFVPQDDIVFAELTVRENLIYSGRFRLPRGTSRSEIEDLADTVMADLGLSRKASSIVGDVTRRGVSGGEKKRVNIGLELMARPSALFLDEPTSGLDASSALLVMTSMKQLVENQGVTVCSVIHQPRKFIFDLFDSVLLLGVGGRMVYHGSVADSFEYFTSLGFKLPQGESLADWLIDISTGRVAVDTIPEVIQEDDGKLDEENQSLIRQPIKSLSIRSHSMLREKSEAGNASSLKYQEPLRQDTQVISTTGHSGNKADRAENEAKVRRELLYENWKRHFSAMSEEQRKVYDPPKAYAYPEKAQMPSFLVQFLLQLRRMFLLAWRNRVTKIIETAVIVFAVAVVTFFDGTTSVSVESIPLVPFEAFIAGQEEVIESFFKPLFEFSLLAGTGYLRYGASVGVISGVLIALTAVKAITEKRLEFFREAGSGYDSNAYFLAVNVYTSVEQGVQIFLAAVIAQWTRQAIATKPIFYVAFLMLAWISVSWSLFIPLIVPPKNTLVLLGFFMAFFGLLFGGTSPPFRYERKLLRVLLIYGTVIANFSAFHRTRIIKKFIRPPSRLYSVLSYLLLVSSRKRWQFPI